MPVAKFWSTHRSNSVLRFYAPSLAPTSQRFFSPGTARVTCTSAIGVHHSFRAIIIIIFLGYVPPVGYCLWATTPPLEVVVAVAQSLDRTQCSSISVSEPERAIHPFSFHTHFPSSSHISSSCRTSRPADSVSGLSPFPSLPLSLSVRHNSKVPPNPSPKVVASDAAIVSCVDWALPNLPHPNPAFALRNPKIWTLTF